MSGRVKKPSGFILRGLLDVTAASNEQQVRDAIERSTQNGLLQPDESIFISALLELELTTEQRAVLDSMDNATRMKRMAEAINGLLRRACEAFPRLYVIEDVHWAGPELLRHLAALTAETAHAPIILRMTSPIPGDPSQHFEGTLMAGPWPTAGGRCAKPCPPVNPDVRCARGRLHRTRRGQSTISRAASAKCSGKRSGHGATDRWGGSY